jgi:hypothetical protein
MEVSIVGTIVIQNSTDQYFRLMGDNGLKEQLCTQLKCPECGQTGFVFSRVGEVFSTKCANAGCPANKHIKVSKIDPPWTVLQEATAALDSAATVLLLKKYDYLFRLTSNDASQEGPLLLAYAKAKSDYASALSAYNESAALPDMKNVVLQLQENSKRPISEPNVKEKLQLEETLQNKYKK